MPEEHYLLPTNVRVRSVVPNNGNNESYNRNDNAEKKNVVTNTQKSILFRQHDAEVV